MEETAPRGATKTPWRTPHLSRTGCVGSSTSDPTRRPTDKKFKSITIQPTSVKDLKPDDLFRVKKVSQVIVYYAPATSSHCQAAITN